MRPRASQVARIRLVETEENVETVHEDNGLSVSVHWPDSPHLVRGGRYREQGEVQFSTSPKLSCYYSDTYN